MQKNYNIAGCRFSLAVMSDDYVPKILNALKAVDTSHVWSFTDLLSTTYLGHKTNVINTLKELFIAVNDNQTHITLEITLSKDNSNKSIGDIQTRITPTTNRLSNQNFDVCGKIAFYPMGTLDYMNHISHITNLAIEANIYDKPSYYATQIRGDVQNLFDYFHEIFDYADKHIEHFIYQITLSINSPSTKKN